MKRLLSSIVLVVWTITILAQSIPQETVGGKIGETIQKEDSIKEVKWQARRDSIKHVNDSLRQLQVLDINRYKLYPTQNKWTFLELDTQTGRIWQVQYSVEGPEYRFKSNLNIWSLLKDNDLQVSGRFELYPTQNIYTFVLLDKISGRTWQVQWSTENARGCWEIL